MFIKNCLLKIRLNSLLLLFSLLVLFYPPVAYSQQLTGTLLFSSGGSYQSITLSNQIVRDTVRVNAYIYSAHADGNKEFLSSSEVSEFGDYTFSNSDYNENNNLKLCAIYLEVNMWETDYVSVYYDGPAGGGTTEGVVNGHHATKIETCSVDSPIVDFHLTKGMRIEGKVEQSSLGLDGVRVGAQALFSYYTTGRVTVINDNVVPNCTPTPDGLYEILPQDTLTRGFVYLRDTYSSEDKVVGNFTLENDEVRSVFCRHNPIPEINSNIVTGTGEYYLRGLANPSRPNFPLAALKDAYINSCEGYRNATINNKYDAIYTVNNKPIFTLTNKSYGIIIDAGGGSSKCGVAFNHRPVSVEIFNDNDEGVLEGSEGGSGVVTYVDGTLSFAFNEMPVHSDRVKMFYYSGGDVQTPITISHIGQTYTGNTGGISIDSGSITIAEVITESDFTDNGVYSEILTNHDFTLQTGKSIIGTISATTGESLCNAKLGLHRKTAIETNDVDCDGAPINRSGREYYKLVSVKVLNHLAYDYSDSGRVCDNSVLPYYTSSFVFNNLGTGSYKIEYMGDYIFSGRKISDVINIQDSSPTVVDTGVFSVEISDVNVELKAPRLFMSVVTGCTKDRLACWVTGNPPQNCCPGIMEEDDCIDFTYTMWENRKDDETNGISCNDWTAAMNEEICNLYTAGEIEEAYNLDDRATHYIMEFYNSDICTGTANANSYTIENSWLMFGNKDVEIDSIEYNGINTDLQNAWPFVAGTNPVNLSTSISSSTSTQSMRMMLDVDQDSWVYTQTGDYGFWNMTGAKIELDLYATALPNVAELGLFVTDEDLDELYTTLVVIAADKWQHFEFNLNKPKVFNSFVGSSDITLSKIINFGFRVKNSGNNEFAYVDNISFEGIKYYDSLTPRECECFDSSVGVSGAFFTVRAYNTFSNEMSAIQSNECYPTPDIFNNLAALDNKPITHTVVANSGSADSLFGPDGESPLAGIKSKDYLSNTTTNTALKPQVQGLVLENKSFSNTATLFETKHNFEGTIQLASLNWVDYLFNLFKKIAGKVLSPGRLIGDGGFFLGGSSGIDSSGTGDTGSPMVALGGTMAFNSLTLMDYATSNLPDADGDGLPDYWEDCQGLDSDSSAGKDGTSGDPDGDGLPNYWEYYYGTDPTNADTDGDGMPDDWEVLNKLNPLLDDSAEDPDGNGLTNLFEYINRAAEVYYVDGWFVRDPESGEGEITGSRDDPFQTFEEALGSISNGSRVILKVLGGDFVDSQVYSLAGDLIIPNEVGFIGDRAATTTIDLGGHQIRMGSGALLTGFTIKTPPDDGSAMIVVNSNETSNTIANNVLRGFNYGTGILLDSSTPLIYNNVILDFYTGISLNNSGQPDIHNNIIGSCAYSVVFSDSAAPIIAFNYLYDNKNNPLTGTEIYSNIYTVKPPDFVSDDNFHLRGDDDGLRDEGDPEIVFNDLDGSRNDIGPDGGRPYGSLDKNVPFASISNLTFSNGQVTLDGTHSMDEWGIDIYDWVYDTSSIYDCEDIEPGKLDCKYNVNNYPSCGNYLVKLTVTDHNDFNATTTKMGEAPITPIDVSGPSVVSRINRQVEFSVEDTSYDNYSWTVIKRNTDEVYGCIESALGKSLDCSFDSPGLYEVFVSASVTDDEQIQCESVGMKLVTVVDEPFYDPVWQPIGPDGGVFTVNNTEYSLYRFSVEIPEEALSEEISITISEPKNVPDLPQELTGIGIPFDLGPDGIGFCMPVRLEIPYDIKYVDDADSAEDLGVFWYDNTISKWQKVSVVDIIEVDQYSGFLVVEINHFSSYQVVVTPKPPAPENLTATATQYNNIRIDLNWHYPSSSNDIDGFIVERSIDQQNWSQIAEGQDNKDHANRDYEYKDSLNIFSTTFYYQVRAYKFLNESTGEKIVSKESNMASATTLDSQGGVTDDPNNDPPPNKNNDNSSDNGDTQSSGGGGGGSGFGCGLVSSGSGSGIDALVRVLVLFFPLFIFRWRARRRR